MTISRLSRRKTLAIFAAVVLAAAGGSVGALAGSASAGGDSSAVAINTKDGSDVFRLTFAIKKAIGDTVDNNNIAVAYASCQLCQTIAISIQVVLVEGQPSVFTPVNIALAYNENCDQCDTLASAYQFAIGVGTKLKFTAAGHKQIEELRRQLKDLRDSGLTGPEIQTQVDGLMHQLAGILATEVVGAQEPAGNGGPAQSDSAPAGEQNPAPADTTPTETTTEPAPSTETTPTTTETAPPTTTTPTETTTEPPPTSTTSG